MRTNKRRDLSSIEVAKIDRRVKETCDCFAVFLDNTGCNVTYRYFWLATILLLTGCSDYQWGWYVLDPSTEQGQTNLKFLSAGFYDTITISLLSMALAMLIGLLVALPSLSNSRWLNGLNRVYVEVIRSIPVLVLLLWVYYGLPTLLDISLDHFWAGVIALTG